MPRVGHEGRIGAALPALANLEEGRKKTAGLDAKCMDTNKIKAKATSLESLGIRSESQLAGIENHGIYGVEVHALLSTWAPCVCPFCSL